MTDQHITAKSESDRISVELSSRRTGMSFQRTRLSADRTLMSVIRTALSMIGFGFTIYQAFEKVKDFELCQPCYLDGRFPSTMFSGDFVKLSNVGSGGNAHGSGNGDAARAMGAGAGAGLSAGDSDR